MFQRPKESDYEIGLLVRYAILDGRKRKAPRGRLVGYEGSVGAIRICDSCPTNTQVLNRVEAQCRAHDANNVLGCKRVALVGVEPRSKGSLLGVSLRIW
jgi:hypothetical protein